ncbi:MAG: Gfo/Idh/MocA family protein, partial [bacterium]
FHPQMERVQQLLRDGAVGPLWLVRAVFSFGVAGPNVRLEAELGGGGLLDVGCYCVNISRLVLGEPSTTFATAVYDRGVDVRLAGALQFPESRMALVDCGLRTPYRQECEIVGADGSISLQRPFQPEEDPAVLLIRRGRGEQVERIEVPGTNQYVRMIDHFAAVVRGAPPRYPARDAVANMRALDALARSARAGEPMMVAS